MHPLVTMALVAHNPGAWFDEVLQSIVAQDYPALEVVVIDAAGDIPVAPRVHAVIAEAVVIPLVANQGFAKNANIILDQPDVGPFLLICHDDVALAPDCVRRLVEETLRSNAGVTGPKLLDWNEPDRILHVGLGADKTGLVSDLAEPGEVDQEQHDAVRDVFAVPGAVTLLRTDLFRALRGFDEAMIVRGEDLDLCWRAHVIGARVLVNPAASARHREDLTTRIAGSDYDRYARRHRIRSLLSNYGLWHSIRVVPQALVAALINAVMALFQGRIGLIAEIAGAWVWNLRRLPSLLRRRRHLASIRQVDDAEVRAFQIPGFEGFNVWRQARAARRNADSSPDGATSAQAVAERARALQVTVLVWFAVIAVLLFGSRELITGGLPLFNEFVGFPNGPSSLITEWSSTWRSTGVGAEAPSSLLHAVLGFAGIALFGQMGLVQLLATVGLVVVGAIGAFRLLAPFRSLQAQLVALIVYATVPLPYNALYEGSWSGLAAYAAMPFVAKRLAMAALIPPFTDPEPRLSRQIADTLLAGLILAAAGLIDPVIVAAPIALIVGWTLGSLASRRVDGTLRMAAVTLGAIAVAFVLLMPSSLGLLSERATWSSIVGAAPVQGQQFGVARLLRLATGPHGNSSFGWILLVVPALALVIGSGQRFAWAVRSWFVVVVSIAVVVLSEAGSIGVAIPTAVVVLAPGALGLAFAAGMAAVAVGSDLRRYRFGWRQLVPFVAVGALALSGLAGLGGAVDGRWNVVTDGYGDVVAFFDERAPAHARTFWIGDATVLPVRGWRYDDDLSFAITQARSPSVLDRAVANPDDTVLEVRDTFESTLAGAGNRLGKDLALYGIRYVVVVESNAPAPFGTIDRPIDSALASRLTEQLDMVRVEVRSGATIYENRAYVPMVSAFGPGLLGVGEPGSTRYELALPEVTSLRSYRGPLGPSDLYFSVPNDTNWNLDLGGQPGTAQAQGWATSFAVTDSGPARLVHTNETVHWVGTLVQLVVWIGLTTILVLARRRRT